MATIKEKGTIAFMSEVQSGTSQNGNAWYRQTIVVEVAGYNGTFRKVALQASGDRVAELQHYMVGDRVEVTYQVTAREYQGKWYNNVDLYKIEPEGEMQQPQMPQPQYPQMQQPRQRGRMQTTPLIPPGACLEPQDDDLPIGR